VRGKTDPNDNGQDTALAAHLFLLHPNASSYYNFFCAFSRTTKIETAENLHEETKHRKATILHDAINHVTAAWVLAIDVVHVKTLDYVNERW
jgi:hypothetical protein